MFFPHFTLLRLLKFTRSRYSRTHTCINKHCMYGVMVGDIHSCVPTSTHSFTVNIPSACLTSDLLELFIFCPQLQQQSSLSLCVQWVCVRASIHMKKAMGIYWCFDNFSALSGQDKGDEQCLGILDAAMNIWRSFSNKSAQIPTEIQQNLKFPWKLCPLSLEKSKHQPHWQRIWKDTWGWSIWPVLGNICGSMMITRNHKPTPTKLLHSSLL